MAKSNKEEEVKVDRRRSGRRQEKDASQESNQESQVVAATPVAEVAEVVTSDAANPAKKTSERRKVQRRRQIDPTTCERDYTDPEIEFMQALDAYKRSSGRMFPTCSEILEVIRDMGYVRIFDADGNALRPEIAELLVEEEDEPETGELGESELEEATA